MKREKDFTSASQWQQSIPRPVCSAHKDFILLYEKAWELAHDHIKDIPGLPQTPYMDEGAGPYDIWIWDTCFMAIFCKYARNRFRGWNLYRTFIKYYMTGQIFPGFPIRNSRREYSSVSIQRIIRRYLPGRNMKISWFILNASSPKASNQTRRCKHSKRHNILTSYSNISTGSVNR